MKRVAWLLWLLGCGGELAPAAVVGLVVFLLALAGFAFGRSDEGRAARL